MSSFKAAFVLDQNLRVEVQTVASLPTLAAGEVLIKNYASASNPIDHKFFHWIPNIQYPRVIGSDVAGTIEGVGAGVVGLKKGDRVLSLLPWALSGQNRFGGYQDYSVSLAQVTTRIPDYLSFAEAATFPLGVVTAGGKLFIDLGLDKSTPTSRDAPKHLDETVLIWGGASSVGAFGVQLAARAGYKVIATASKHNHEYVKSLGAHFVFDYRDADVVKKIQKAAGGPIYKALDSISENGTVEQCMEALAEKGTVAIVLPFKGTPIKNIAINNVHLGGLWNEDLKEFSNWFFRNYLETLLEEKLVVANPIQRITGWLDGAQEMLNAHVKGVSGKKLVISRND